MSPAQKILPTLIQPIDAMNEKIGHCISWLALAMVLITFLVVVLRYAFNLGWIALQEVVGYCHGLLIMLGMAYTLKHDAHVRVDILYQRCSERGRAWIDLLGSLFLLLPFCAFIFWSSWDYVTDAWAIREGSREAGGLPGLFLLKTSILMMAALLLLQGVALALSQLLRIMQPAPGHIEKAD